MFAGNVNLIGGCKYRQRDKTYLKSLLGFGRVKISGAVIPPLLQLQSPTATAAATVKGIARIVPVALVLPGTATETKFAVPVPVAVAAGNYLIYAFNCNGGDSCCFMFLLQLQVHSLETKSLNLSPKTANR